MTRLALWRLRHAIRWRWLRLRGLTGEFDAPEDSDRCRALTAAWRRHWPEAEPIGYLLRGIYADRWVRFHSLPHSKRYADTPEEAAEVLRRHRVVLSEISGGASPGTFVVIAEDYGTNSLSTGQSRRHAPGAWPWRRIADEEDEPDTYFHYLWATSGLTTEQLDELLMAVAEDQACAIITDDDLAWLYYPYDGGADVILPDTPTRDALRERHADWLSSHPGGL